MSMKSVVITLYSYSPEAFLNISFDIKKKIIFLFSNFCIICLKMSLLILNWFLIVFLLTSLTFIAIDIFVEQWLRNSLISVSIFCFIIVFLLIFIGNSKKLLVFIQIKISESFFHDQNQINSFNSCLLCFNILIA